MFECLEIAILPINPDTLGPMKVDTKPEKNIVHSKNYTTLHCQDKTFQDLKLCVENSSYSIEDLILYPQPENISSQYHFFNSRLPVVTPPHTNLKYENIFTLVLNTSLTYQIFIFDRKNRFISPIPEKLPVSFVRLDNKPRMNLIYLKAIYCKG